VIALKQNPQTGKWRTEETIIHPDIYFSRLSPKDDLLFGFLAEEFFARMASRRIKASPTSSEPKDKRAPGDRQVDCQLRTWNIEK
jgi:hypothetical protein